MRKYVIMGVQGSGKDTQAQMLAADLDLVHISVGDIFRWNVHAHTKMGAQVRRVMAAGELVGDGLVESVVREDGTEEALAVRLRDYHDKTEPVLDLFRRKEYVFADGALDKLVAQEDVTEVVCTNSVPVPGEHPKLRVISVAPALAEAISRIHDGESVSALFDR